MREFMIAVDGKLVKLANNINFNTDRQIETSMKTLKSPAINMPNVMRTLVSEFQLSNWHMKTILQTLVATVQSFSRTRPTPN